MHGPESGGSVPKCMQRDRSFLRFLTTRSPAHFQGEPKFNNFIGHRGPDHCYRKGLPGKGEL